MIVTWWLPGVAELKGQSCRNSCPLSTGELRTDCEGSPNVSIVENLLGAAASGQQYDAIPVQLKLSNGLLCVDLSTDFNLSSQYFCNSTKNDNSALVS